MIDPGSALQKKDLTPDKFEILLLRLDADRNRAGEKYEEIRWKLIKFFQWGFCHDAEHLADETFNRVAEKLAGEKEIINIAGFAWGVAKKIRQEAVGLRLKTVYFSGMPRADVGVTESHATQTREQEIKMRENHLRCLRRCMQHLSPDDRKFVLAYHSPKGRRVEGRQRLAQENGISMVALRVRASRLRFKLEECLKRCLADKAG